MEYKLDVKYILKPDSFSAFAALQNCIADNAGGKVEIDCTNTEYIHPAFIPLLGSLPHLGNIYSTEVIIRYSKSKSKKYILDSGILKYYDDNGESPSSKLPFDSLNYENLKNFSDVKTAITKIIDTIPEGARILNWGMLFSQIGEIFNNAKDHSNLQQYEKLYYSGTCINTTCVVSIYDSGVGIKRPVCKYLGREVTDTEALAWVFEDGNSTRNSTFSEITRGIGLNSLMNFVETNNGSLIVCSGTALCEVKGEQNSIKCLNYGVKGTLYVLTVNVNNALEV